MILSFFFVFGLIVGSFLNVVVCRLKEAETLLGRSFCRSCEGQIRWYDNIPLLSFLFLQGRCRDCREKISWQYPLLELATAVCFVLVGGLFFASDDRGTWLETAWLLGMVGLLLSIAVYDLVHMEIPVSLLIISVLWAGLFLGIDYFMRNSWQLLWWESRLAQGVLGGGIVTLFFFSLVYASRETWMGWGDVWLGGIVGLVVGFHAVLFMLTLSFGLGALWGLFLMIFKKKEMKSQLPFAPYLVFGTLFTLFLPRLFPDSVMWLLLFY